MAKTDHTLYEAPDYVAQNPVSDASAATIRVSRFPRRAVAAACALVALVTACVCGGTFAGAAADDPDYAWYAADPSASVFTLSDEQDYLGFVKLVNGTADVNGDGEAEEAVAFEDATVTLASNLDFGGSTLQSVGGAGTDAEFDGTFDGGGHEISGAIIDTSVSSQNLGLFGKTGSASVIKNLSLASDVTLSVALTSKDVQAIKNVGLLVGQCAGDIENCSSAGTVNVSHAANQTKSLMYPVKDIGGLAGIVLGDVTDCTAESDAALDVSSTGAPYAPSEDEEDEWNATNLLAQNIGGLVGCVGAPDSTETSIADDRTVDNTHGNVSGCTNAGAITVNTPTNSGYDRFGNHLYAQGSNVGGVAGYCRGNVSECRNDGNLDCVNSVNIGGIVGNLRAATTPQNFSEEGNDDGILLTKAGKEEDLTVSGCRNAGIVYGRAYAGGIVGRSGSYIAVTECLNEEDGMVFGTRVTKPFPAGIIGSCYGTVSYCANLGTVVSGRKSSVDQEVSDLRNSYTTGGGYYAAGIAGGTFYYTEGTTSSNQTRNMPLPDIYGCYNAGTIAAIDNMRQRALVGDNSGYVHDCVALQGKVYQDKLLYGLYDGDSETSGGVIKNVTLVDNEQLKGAKVLSSSQLAGVAVDEDTLNAALSDVAAGNGAGSAFTLLNANADKGAWAVYWALSDGSVNNGYPVLNSQVTWNATEVTADGGAQVQLVANGTYTGLAAVPKVRVTLADGTQLQQGRDFRVVPQTDGIEVTDEDETPYRASIQFIGAYCGTLTDAVAYGIDKGDLSDCTVTIDPVKFNWEAQTPTASQVHVLNAAGAEVASDEYTFALDSSDKDLTDGKAVNAKRYTVNVTAASGSAHFTGTATGEFNIDSVKIICYRDAEDQKATAYPVSISTDATAYAYGKNGSDGTVKYESDLAIPWHSMTVYPDDDPTVAFQYTGHTIKPTVDEVTYLGKNLTEGVDYRVIYGGSALTEGSSNEADNVGKSGAVEKGYITVRYIQGGNFQNYENMTFAIDGTDTLAHAIASADAGGASGIDIAKAQVKGADDIVYEAGDPYTPITVWYAGSQLTEGTDYTITYTDNDAVGTARYTITGTGAFKGTQTGTFNIVSGQAYTLSYDYDTTSNTATVTGFTYNGVRDGFTVDIPSTVEHDGAAYTVTAIGSKAFGGSVAGDFQGANADKTKVTAVTIPASVQTIDSYAFGSAYAGTPLSQLKTVTFASGSKLTSIGTSAFDRTGIASVDIPAGVERIGQLAFAHNDNLKTVTFESEDAAIPVLDWKAGEGGEGGAGGFATVVKSAFAYDYALTMRAHDAAATVKQYYTDFTAANSAKYSWTWKSLDKATAINNKSQTLKGTASYSKAAYSAAFSLNAASSASGAKLTYASSNKAVATVTSAGKVTPKKTGTATITVTATADGYTTATKKVTVKVVASKTAGSGKTKATYKVTAKGKVAYTKTQASGSASVPDTVKIDGATYAVTNISNNAFKGAKATAITVGSNVTNIAAGTFKGAKKLKTLTLGTGVKKIAKKAFATNTKLTKLVVKTKKLTKAASVKGCLKGSKVKTVQVKVGSKTQNKKYRTAYLKTLGKKSVSGKKVAIK